MPQGLYEWHRNKSQLVMNGITKLRNAYQRGKSELISRLKYKIHLLDILSVFSMIIFCKVNVKSCIYKPTKQSICSLNAGEGIIKELKTVLYFFIYIKAGLDLYRHFLI